MIYSQAKYVEESILTNNRNKKYIDNIRTYTIMPSKQNRLKIFRISYVPTGC